MAPVNFYIRVGSSFASQRRVRLFLILLRSRHVCFLPCLHLTRQGLSLRDLHLPSSFCEPAESLLRFVWTLLGRMGERCEARQNRFSGFVLGILTIFILP
jgi:hypothetical protein